ncbi:GAF domain-containing protein [Hazenella coriacea]|uniref:GAF domain-containing protein n=1 Tax=Hazenella coriacea TaxID=1179467 RepID=A0A4V2UV15_9BACL|nr:GAF domain-containing protein [Hazenella coriacea]TCS93897.1 hypothetical protein EDD58_105106 [Hazenella coriacea]
MSTEDLIKIAEIFDENTGWFLEFMGYFVAIGLVAIFIVHIYRFATGQSDWLGRGEEPNVELTQIQSELNQKEKEELEAQVRQYELDKVSIDKRVEDLEKELQMKETEIELKNTEIDDWVNEWTALKQLFEELDEKYDDETYAASQIMYTVEEVALALANQENFQKNKGDIYINLLDYLINTLKGFREKNPRVVIHIKDPKRDDVLIHYAHSSGHSHRVKDFQPTIYGSAAGRAWRTGEIYYIPDVEAPDIEYYNKERPNKYYRTLLCVPLKAGNDANTKIGVLSITGKPGNAYEKIEIERVILFSSLLYPLIYMDTKMKGVSPNGEH